MKTQSLTYQWIDWPEEDWFASEWNFGHIGCAAFAFFLYIIPGVIFIIIKQIARRNYLKEYQRAKENHSYAFEHTDCHYLASVTHLGGHPLLPYKGRVILGIKSDSVNFYNYQLLVLHSASLKDVSGIADTRHVQTTSYGSVYKPEGSSFGTTTSTQNIEMHPDTLKLTLLVKGQRCVAEFDMRPYDPLNFLDTFNKTKLGV